MNNDEAFYLWIRQVYWTALGAHRRDTVRLGTVDPYAIHAEMSIERVSRFCVAIRIQFYELFSLQDFQLAGKEAMIMRKRAAGSSLAI